MDLTLDSPVCKNRTNKNSSLANPGSLPLLTQGSPIDFRPVRRLLGAVSFARAFLLLMVLSALPPWAPSTFAAEAPKKTLLILGDSLAAGYGLDPGEAFPALLQKRADSAGLPVTVVNAGVSGDTTAGGLRRMDWLLRRPVDILLLELGGNDGLRGLSPDATRTNLTQIIRKTRDRNPSAAVVVAGMEMPPNMGEAYGRQFREVFPEVARQEKATLIPFLLAGVGGIAELNQPDQIHPTAAGHALIASNVWVLLEPVLKAATHTQTPGTPVH